MDHVWRCQDLKDNLVYHSLLINGHDSSYQWGHITIHVTSGTRATSGLYLFTLISGGVSGLQHLTELLHVHGLLSSVEPVLQPPHQDTLVPGQHRLVNGDPGVADTGRRFSQLHLFQEDPRVGWSSGRHGQAVRSPSAPARRGASAASDTAASGRRGRTVFREAGTLRLHVLLVAAAAAAAALRVPHGSFTDLGRPRESLRAAGCQFQDACAGQTSPTLTYSDNSAVHYYRIDAPYVILPENVLCVLQLRMRGGFGFAEALFGVCSSTERNVM